MRGGAGLPWRGLVVPSTGAPRTEPAQRSAADPPPRQLPAPGTLGLLSIFKTKPQLPVSPYLCLSPLPRGPKRGRRGQSVS